MGGLSLRRNGLIRDYFEVDDDDVAAGDDDDDDDDDKEEEEAEREKDLEIRATSFQRPMSFSSNVTA
jgi:hypothetical protein